MISCFRPGFQLSVFPSYYDRDFSSADPLNLISGSVPLPGSLSGILGRLHYNTDPLINQNGYEGYHKSF